MFKCQKCNRTTKPNEKMTKIVTKIKPKTYVNVVRNKEKFSQGTEIIEEISLCESCASKIDRD